MFSSNDISEQLSLQTELAYQQKQPLKIIGGNSKSFYGNTVSGEELNVSQHTGTIEYHPSELVLTARSGTTIHEIESTLKDNNQMLAFEPPAHTANATLGGAIATGLSGPGRATYGAARDFVLGTRIINGKGEILKFGGQVMKNVAGYDASRLMVGAQGTLGLLLDISVKVLPIPQCETTLSLTYDQLSANERLQKWIKSGHPISASCYYDNNLHIRLSSTDNSVKHAVNSIGGDITDNSIWDALRNQTHDFFTSGQSDGPGDLWRCSHQSTTQFYGEAKNQLIEWNGALRWIKSKTDQYTLAAEHGGHATRYPINTGRHASDIFQPLQPALFKIHERLKHAFDPENILNPGRLYHDL